MITSHIQYDLATCANVPGTVPDTDGIKLIPENTLRLTMDLFRMYKELL